MESMTLGQALELEHRAIDGGIESFIESLDGAGPSGPAPLTSAPLTSALNGLRRHIYLEEQFLFPPLKAAGLMGPLFVMVREHGQLWRQMNVIAALLPDGTDADTGAEDTLRGACTELLALLDAHNATEDPIIYTQADDILGTTASNDLLDFLAAGSMPEGWVCSAA